MMKKCNKRTCQDCEFGVYRDANSNLEKGTIAVNIECHKLHQKAIKLTDVQKFIKILVEGWASTDEMTPSLFKKLQVQLKQIEGDKLI